MEKSILLMLIFVSLSLSISPPAIFPASWTASDDFAWDSSVDVPKGPGSDRNTLVIPSTVDGLVLKCSASYPIEWVFHHSQLASHFTQRSSRGRWWTTVSTTRKSTDLFDAKFFEYIAELRFIGSSNGITGNYTCQKVGDESVSRSKYVFWEANSPPFLIQQGQNNTAVLNPATNTTILQCTVARPDILVALLKYNTNGSNWMELKKNESVQYDPKQGFILMNLKDPFGQYKCLANSDKKDFATVHVVPITSPEASPVEFSDTLKRPAKFGYDKEKQQFFCCSRSNAPSMMHFYCDHPATCKLRKNSLLNMENTGTRNGSCSSVRLFLRNAGVFRCLGDGIDIVREYFFPMGFQFGFGRNRSRNSLDPYYSWKDADANKMISLRLWNDQIYVGQNVTFACQVSSYYFSRGIRWRLGFKNGPAYTVPEALVNDTKKYYHQWFRRNINSLVVHADLNLTSVECYAPVWNTSEWKNQTVKVNAQVPVKPVIVGGTASEIVIEWYVNETNKIIDCEVTGDPRPSISWKKDKKSFFKYSRPVLLNNESSVLSVVNISRVSYETHGEYVCTVKNLAGTATKIYKILVIERTSSGIIVTIVIFIVLLVMNLGGVVYFVIRTKNQKKIINKLAVTAFKEVEAIGNANGNQVVPADPIFDFNTPAPAYTNENTGNEKDEGYYHRI